MKTREKQFEVDTGSMVLWHFCNGRCSSDREPESHRNGNIQCAQTPGVTTVSFENNVYRSTYTGVGKAIDACLGSETKGDLQLVVLENRIPRLCINLPDTLTAAYRNGEISLTQVYQQMGITVDTDPAMKALKMPVRKKCRLPGRWIW